MKVSINLTQALELCLAGTPLSIDEALALDNNTKDSTDALCDAADAISAGIKATPSTPAP